MNWSEILDGIITKRRLIMERDGMVEAGRIYEYEDHLRAAVHEAMEAHATGMKTAATGAMATEEEVGAYSSAFMRIQGLTAEIEEACGSFAHPGEDMVPRDTIREALMQTAALTYVLECTLARARTAVGTTNVAFAVHDIPKAI